MFIRNNLLTPDIDAGTHRLVIKGLVERNSRFRLINYVLPSPS
jgi:hypothetical protein